MLNDASNEVQTPLIDVKPQAPRVTAKSRMLMQLTSPAGVSLQELCDTSGWQAHSCRAFLTALRKTASVECMTMNDGPRRYRVYLSTEPVQQDACASDATPHLSGATTYECNTDVPPGCEVKDTLSGTAVSTTADCAPTVGAELIAKLSRDAAPELISENAAAFISETAQDLNPELDDKSHLELEQGINPELHQNLNAAPGDGALQYNSGPERVCADEAAPASQVNVDDLPAGDKAETDVPEIDVPATDAIIGAADAPHESPKRKGARKPSASKAKDAVPGEVVPVAPDPKKSKSAKRTAKAPKVQS